MTRRRAAILVAVLTVSAFIAGAVTAVVREWGSSLVFVTVENETEHPLGSVTVTYSTCGSQTAVSVPQLPAGEKHTFKFSVCGEGGYRTRAELQNGATLLSSGGYVESGYNANEYVEQTRIRSEVRMFHW